MTEKYGIQSRLVASSAETPVSTSTELVFIGTASCADVGGAAKSSAPYLKAVKCNSLSDYTNSFGTDLTLAHSLSHAAISAFTYQNLDHAWFINIKNPSESTTGTVSADLDDVAAGLNALDSIFMEGGAIPSVVCIPMLQVYNNGDQYSSISTLLAQASTACGSIAGRYKAQIITTNSQASSNVGSNNRINVSSVSPSVTDERVILVYGNGVTGASPSASSNWVDGAAYAASRRVAQDATNTGGLPYRSIGNLYCKDIKGACIIDVNGVALRLTTYETTEATATDIQEKGLITFLNQGSNSYYTWGDHTSAVGAATFDERARFDSSIAMTYSIANRFIEKWKSEIDNPMTLSLRNDILAEENSYLSYLVAVGALVGDPVCEFRPVDNTNDTLAQGQFYFTNVITHAIPAKYLQLNIQYTDSGLSVYTE